MLFSSITFIYYFLPIFLIIYYILPNKLKNIFLLLTGIIFYFYSDPKSLLFLLILSIINYFLGKLVKKKIYLIISIIFNVSVLFYFKYLNFFLENINNIFSINLNINTILLPLGLSFYTFKLISYLIDIYKGKIDSPNILNYLNYIFLFPTILEGPIIRFNEIEKELTKRTPAYNKFATGTKRFILGLAKKVIFADTLLLFSKSLSSLNNPTVLSYWLKAINDTIILYLDFSGYCDMAIGLGLLIGFTIPENFNYPLFSTSITEFWRKWHMTLSNWFKDYIYIPLGGNRVKTLNRCLNILIVWLLTGFWHGASWNFIIWGLYYAIILIIEKYFLKEKLEKHKILGLIYTNLLVIIGFVIFNQTNLNNLFIFLKSLLGLSKIPLINIETTYYFKNYLIILLISILICTPFIKRILNKISKLKISIIAEPIFYILLLILTTAFIVNSSTNPFLYFRF